MFQTFEYFTDSEIVVDISESLVLGFLKEDLFYFLEIIFQDFLFFISLCRVVLLLADINIVSEPSEFVCYMLLPCSGELLVKT